MTTQPVRRVISLPLHKLLENDGIFKRMQEIQDAIARRAFELFEASGSLCGSDLDDWFKAEAELLKPIALDMKETDNEVFVRAQMPGFSENQIDIRLEPKRLFITGKQEKREEKKEKAKTVYAELLKKEVFRCVSLPVAIDPDKAKATLSEGILEITLPKAEAAKKISVAAKVA